jgi:hypothetical protein
MRLGRRLACVFGASAVAVEKFRRIRIPDDSEVSPLPKLRRFIGVRLASDVHPIFRTIWREETLKLEKHSFHGKTTICLIGRFQSEHVEELEKQIQNNEAYLVLDLLEVTLVDLGVVQFLALCEANGTELLHCPAYVREWIRREREAGPQATS